VKRVVSIAFVLLFLLLSGGVQILVHTCSGETTVEMMPASAEDPCGCGDEGPDARCCTLVLKSFQLDEMQQVIATSLPTLEPVAAARFPLALDLPAEPALDQLVAAGTSPPPAVSPTILNCTFLI
jgi:hypothetical protein